MGRYTAGGMGRDMLAGAIAGVAAIWVADKLDKALYSSGGADAIQRTEAARPGGMDPDHVLAKRAADAAGVTLENPKDNAGGHAIHYGIAAGMGALYGLLRGAAPGFAAGRGALFGFAMFVMKEQVGNTMLGTAGHPLKYPMRDHARGAASHTLFGIMTDMAIRVLSPYRDQVVVMQGPPLRERLDNGRQQIVETRDRLLDAGQDVADQGRTYLGQGIETATRYVEQARARLPDVDTDELARRGRHYAGQAADTVRSQVRSQVRSGAPEVRRMARRCRKEAERLAEEARSYVPDAPVSTLNRALGRLFG